MDDLAYRELTLIKRAAEDAIHACNRHYAPFVDVVAHPLNILALVEMAQMKVELKLKIEQLEKGKAEITRLVQSLRNEFDLNSDCPQVERQIELLEGALRGECE